MTAAGSYGRPFDGRHRLALGVGSRGAEAGAVAGPAGSRGPATAPGAGAAGATGGAGVAGRQGKWVA